MATKASAKSTLITISPPAFEWITVKIKGTAPLVINRFSLKAMKQIQEDQEAGDAGKRKRREPKDFKELFEAAKHVSEEGWEGIHAAAFRNGAIRAASAAGVEMTKAKLAFAVEADGFDRVDGVPLVRLTSGVAENWITPVRVGMNKMDIRPRPMYKQWSALLRVRFDSQILSANNLVNLINRVGTQVGIGEGRPFGRASDSGGLGFGLFEIDGLIGG